MTPGALPPVVDIEFYGDNLKDPPEADHVKAVLDPLLERLEADVYKRQHIGGIAASRRDQGEDLPGVLPLIHIYS